MITKTIDKAIKQIEEYIKLYKADIPFIRNSFEKSINNRSIEELNHIKRILKNEN